MQEATEEQEEEGDEVGAVGSELGQMTNGPLV